MKTIDIKAKVEALRVNLPPVDHFWRLGDLTALRRDNDGRFYRANYERGILLYALVARYRPTTVLEFGTGRGYGCLCMAWAMQAHDIPGRIYTVDLTPPGEPFAWAIDWGKGPVVECLSRDRVWPQAAPREWLDRIEILTGFSGQVMRRWRGPTIELAFIDGGHGYDVVRHDLYAFLEVAATRFGILFDDYVPRPAFGVQRLIDQEVAPHFDVELIYTDRRWPGEERAGLEDPGYGMVWVHSETLKGPLEEAFDADTRRSLLARYRVREVWSRLRFRAGRALRSMLQSRSGVEET
jgi:hypothetical protein